MIVYDKATNECVNVFDITYDKSGYPHFLIYKDNQWLRISAKHFRPYSANISKYEPFGCGIHINDNIDGRIKSYEK